MLAAFRSGTIPPFGLLVVLAVLGLTTTSSGRVVQSPGPGAFASVGPQATRGYFSQFPFERVDMVNGNVTLTFPGLVLPGNAGMDVRIVRTYTQQPSANQGQWALTFTDVPHVFVQDLDELGQPRLTATLGTGATKKFHSNALSGYWLSTDFWSYSTAAHILALPDGRLARYEVAVASFPTFIYRLHEIEDPFGNKITVVWDGSGSQVPIDKIVQTVAGVNGNQQREVEFSVTPGVSTTVSYDGKTWTYTNDSIIPPTGPNWSITRTGFTDWDDPSGTVTVTLPTGGTVAYSFEEYNERSCISQIVTGGRAVVGGTWEFEFDSQNLQTSVVTQPSSGRTITYKHEFYVGPDAYDWILKERTVSDGAHSSSTQWSYEDVPFLTFPPTPLKATKKRELTQDGVTYTTEGEFTTQNGPFKDYLRPFRITESSSSHSKTRFKTRTFFYSPNRYFTNRIASETVAIGSESFTSSTTYDDFTGAVTSVTQLGDTTQVTPDAAGNVFQVTDPLSHQVASLYKWGVPSQTTSPELAVTREINPDGTVLSELRGNHNTTFEYDALGRIRKVMPDGLFETETTYDSNGAWVQVSRGGRWSRTDLDGFGRPIGTEDSAGVKTAITYDAEGRKTFESYPWVGQGGTAGTDYTYDFLGRVKQITHEDGNFVRYEYGVSSLTVFDEQNHRTIQFFEAFGSPGNARLTAVEDAKARSGSIHMTSLAT
jgi:YD repeat-containing protein